MNRKGMMICVLLAGLLPGTLASAQESAFTPTSRKAFSPLPTSSTITSHTTRTVVEQLAAERTIQQAKEFYQDGLAKRSFNDPNSLTESLAHGAYAPLRDIMQMVGGLGITAVTDGAPAAVRQYYDQTSAYIVSIPIQLHEFKTLLALADEKGEAQLISHAVVYFVTPLVVGNITARTARGSIRVKKGGHITQVSIDELLGDKLPGESIMKNGDRVVVRVDPIVTPDGDIVRGAFDALAAELDYVLKNPGEFPPPKPKWNEPLSRGPARPLRQPPKGGPSGSNPRGSLINEGGVGTLEAPTSVKTKPSNSASTPQAKIQTNIIELPVDARHAAAIPEEVMRLWEAEKQFQFVTDLFSKVRPRDSTGNFLTFGQFLLAYQNNPGFFEQQVKPLSQGEATSVQASIDQSFSGGSSSYSVVREKAIEEEIERLRGFDRFVRQQVAPIYGDGSLWMIGGFAPTYNGLLQQLLGAKTPEDYRRFFTTLEELVTSLSNGRMKLIIRVHHDPRLDVPENQALFRAFYAGGRPRLLDATLVTHPNSGADFYKQGLQAMTTIGANPDKPQDHLIELELYDTTSPWVVAHEIVHVLESVAHYVTPNGLLPLSWETFADPKLVSVLIHLLGELETQLAGMMRFNEEASDELLYRRVLESHNMIRIYIPMLLQLATRFVPGNHEFLKRDSDDYFVKGAPHEVDPGLYADIERFFAAFRTTCKQLLAQNIVPQHRAAGETHLRYLSSALDRLPLTDIFVAYIRISTYIEINHLQFIPDFRRRGYGLDLVPSTWWLAQRVETIDLLTIFRAMIDQGHGIWVDGFRQTLDVHHGVPIEFASRTPVSDKRQNAPNDNDQRLYHVIVPTELQPYFSLHDWLAAGSPQSLDEIIEMVRNNTAIIATGAIDPLQAAAGVEERIKAAVLKRLQEAKDWLRVESDGGFTSSEEFGTTLYYQLTEKPLAGFTGVDEESRAIFIAFTGAGNVGASGRGWLRTTASLSRYGIAVITPEHPFVGVGPRDEKFNDLDTYMQHLEAIINHYKKSGKPVYLVGKSFGTGVVQELFYRNPDVASGGLCIAPGADQTTALGLQYRAYEAYANTMGERQPDPIAEPWTLRIGAQLRSKDQRLTTTAPIVTMSGDNDPLNTPGLLQALNANYQNGRVVVYPGVNHFNIMTYENDGKNVVVQQALLLVAAGGVTDLVEKKLPLLTAAQTLQKYDRVFPPFHRYLITQGITLDTLLTDDARAAALYIEWEAEYIKSLFSLARTILDDRNRQWQLTHEQRQKMQELIASDPKSLSQANRQWLCACLGNVQPVAVGAPIELTKDVVTAPKVPAFADLPVHAAPANYQELMRAFANGLEIDPTNVNQLAGFNIYRVSNFGDHATPIDDEAIDILKEVRKKHPELGKISFRSHHVRLPQKSYPVTPALRSLSQTLATASGKTHAKFFPKDRQAHRAFWLNLKTDDGDPLFTVQDYETIFSTDFFKFLDDPAQWNEWREQGYTKYYKRITIFIQEIARRGNQSRELAQLLVDFVSHYAFQNPNLAELFASNDGMERLLGIRLALADRDLLCFILGYKSGFDEFLKRQGVTKPSGFPDVTSLDRSLVVIEQELENVAQLVPGQYREFTVRPLSFTEAGFRGALGKDCSSKSYFETAFDANYHYFTITDARNHSMGQITVVLGSARRGNETVAVAFVDKIQNVASHDLQTVLEMVRRSVLEEGFLLAIPADVGNHAGLSNAGSTRLYVSNVLPTYVEQTELLSGFVPLRREVAFPHGASRAYDNLDVKPLLPARISVTTAIDPAEKVEAWRTTDFNLNMIHQSIQGWRHGTVEDKLNYIAIVPQLPEADANFDTTLSDWVDDPNQEARLRKRVLTYYLHDGRQVEKLKLHAPRLPKALRHEVVDQWLQSTVSQGFVHTYARFVMYLVADDPNLLQRVCGDFREMSYVAMLVNELTTYQDRTIADQLLTFLRDRYTSGIPELAPFFALLLRLDERVRENPSSFSTWWVKEATSDERMLLIDAYYLMGYERMRSLLVPLQPDEARLLAARWYERSDFLKLSRHRLTDLIDVFKHNPELRRQLITRGIVEENDMLLRVEAAFKSKESQYPEETEANEVAVLMEMLHEFLTLSPHRLALKTFVDGYALVLMLARQSSPFATTVSADLGALLALIPVELHIALVNKIFNESSRLKSEYLVRMWARRHARDLSEEQGESPSLTPQEIYEQAYQTTIDQLKISMESEEEAAIQEDADVKELKELMEKEPKTRRDTRRIAQLLLNRQTRDRLEQDLDRMLRISMSTEDRATLFVYLLQFCPTETARMIHETFLTNYSTQFPEKANEIRQELARHGID